MSLNEQEQIEQLYMTYKAAKKVIESTQKIIEGFDDLDWGLAERYEKEKNNE